jgi:hypothetical protein
MGFLAWIVVGLIAGWDTVCVMSRCTLPIPCCAPLYSYGSAHDDMRLTRVKCWCERTLWNCAELHGGRADGR